MAKSKVLLSNGSNADEIELAFYDALQNGDIEKIMACWADEDDIVCVYPDGPRLLGPALIRTSFEGVISHRTLRITPHKIHRVESLSSSVHSVLECVEVMLQEGPHRAYMIVTNVYQKTAQGWRMVARHASSATAHELQEISESPKVLH